ncbi:hypothetical protein KR074_012423, partial [Drosophila pseudoananassae]
MSDPQESRNEFSRILTDIITQDVAKKSRRPRNTVFSPASIQSCLTLAYMAATGSTAEELNKGLLLGPGDRHHIARTFGDFWRTNCNYGDRGPILKSVNRLYVNSNLELHPEFNEVASNFFQTKAEPLEFADPASATKYINEWVEKETEQRITNLLQPNAVDDATSAVLINALYFKGKWQKPFMPEATGKHAFFVDADTSIEVDMMTQEDKFKFAELRHLKAKALQLSYVASHIHMLIILPDDRFGLQDLEAKLKDTDLTSIDEAMTIRDVDISLPQFSIEFDVDLKDILKKLGIAEIFTEAAQLDGLFTTKEKQRISAARHRGYINVNEAGSEAAAVSFMKIVPMMLNMNTKKFKADHPFVFYIRNSQAVFFAGRF